MKNGTLDLYSSRQRGLFLKQAKLTQMPTLDSVAKLLGMPDLKEIIIDEGHFEGEDLSGLQIGLMVEISGRMAEGNWKVAAYVDESASGKAYNGILQIFSGAAGGTTGLFTMLVSEIIGAERAPVKIERDGNRRRITIGRKIQGEIEAITGASPDHPVMITNSKYWMGPDIVAARGLVSKVRDYGRVWDFGGKSAEICAIDWKGPKP